MIDIEFTIKGKKTTLDEVAKVGGGEDLAKALRALHDELEGKLQKIFCHEHQQYPRAKVKGNTIEDIEVSVDGCCPPLIAEAERAFQ